MHGLPGGVTSRRFIEFNSARSLRQAVSRDLQLVNRELVGVDTVNVDNSKDLTRPAHTLLLKEEILIVENLMNLDKLYDKKFRFFAVPLKAKKVAAMPIRAFAEIL